MKHSYRSLFAVPMMLAVVAAFGCSSHQPAGAAASAAPSAAPAVLATPYLGVEKMYRAFLKSRNEQVLIVSLAAVPRGTDLSARADSVYAGIKGSLQQSDVGIAVIRIPMVRTANASGDAVFVYERDPKGVWSRVQDPGLLGAIDRAGL